MQAKNITWIGKHIEIEPPKRTKKITGTRLAGLLGLNKWTTPFKIWCELTRTYEEPFVDNQYTLAGKAIEPILIDFLSNRYFLDLKTPTDVYGPDYFKKTWGDFYKDKEIFGGMWDAIGEDTIVEIKTTKRSEDWLEDTPEYYKIQAALYAYLSGYNHIIFCCGFLTDADYEHPENFKPEIGKNIVVREYYMNKDFLDFETKCIEPAIEFWNDYVLNGVSPVYDNKADADTIKALKTASMEVDKDTNTIIQELEALMYELDKIKAEAAPIEKKVKGLNEQLKKAMLDEFTSGTDLVEAKGNRLVFIVSKSVSQDINKAALKADGLLEKYSTEKVTYKLTNKKMEE